MKNADNLKSKTGEMTDEAGERVEGAREKAEDMYDETMQDVGVKGGEVKGRMEQWAEDTFGNQDDSDSSEMDPNPLDPMDDEDEDR